MGNIINAADLFCGAGGTSTGLLNAAKRLGMDVRLLAINHWNVAIQTHQANHPGARHLTTGLESVTPADVVPGGKLDLLWASPSCTHHSVARGGRPRCDQSRAQPHLLLDWMDQLYVRSVHEPFATITTKDRFGVVMQYGLDILFRMLQPHELALAHSFPRDYHFAGNKGDVVRQIGNSVPSKTSEELCYAALSA